MTRPSRAARPVRRPKGKAVELSRQAKRRRLARELAKLDPKEEQRMAEEGMVMLERLKPFVGVVSSDQQHSADTHQKYRLALSKKHRGGGSR